ncbi:hypothetical protein MYCTH_2295391 [Thermothelomyces thermophilus ATCC 42464]|uniref:Uncharacterized protein n=1 Tax=Thermothelomyces thermophilus (strain ATCC 42464 / BCRC 31852 / DSM 1799) TaxID=573729 RepID=G2Q4K5_THET4|nr:uncharacterized protein MYCTH_2295391 [Thermothelomyces thermophilus ATCC 42464]AEO53698.1 hypothetical protein MYCTH_2295391 [Thermothelomyces thermophilus ATCC 42464]
MTSAAAEALLSPSLPPSPPPPPPPPATTVDDGYKADDDGDGDSENGSKGPNEPRLSSFYSFYTLTMCEGDMTADGASRIIKCHPYFSKHLITIPAISSATSCAAADNNNNKTNNNVDNADDSYSDDDPSGVGYGLQFAVDNLITLLKTVAAFQSIGIGLTGLAAFAAVPAASLDDADCRGGDEYGPGGGGSARQRYSWAVWFNLACASAAALFLLLGALTAAAGAKVAEESIDELGAVRAAAGRSWVALAWAAVALVVAAVVHWAVRGARWRKMLRGEREERRERERKKEMEQFARRRVEEATKQLGAHAQKGKEGPPRPGVRVKPPTPAPAPPSLSSPALGFI